MGLQQLTRSYWFAFLLVAAWLIFAVLLAPFLIQYFHLEYGLWSGVIGGIGAALIINLLIGVRINRTEEFKERLFKREILDTMERLLLRLRYLAYLAYGDYECSFHTNYLGRLSDDLCDADRVREICNNITSDEKRYRMLMEEFISLFANYPSEVMKSNELLPARIVFGTAGFGPIESCYKPLPVEVLDHFDKFERAGLFYYVPNEVKTEKARHVESCLRFLIESANVILEERKKYCY